MRKSLLFFTLLLVAVISFLANPGLVPEWQQSSFHDTQTISDAPIKDFIEEQDSDLSVNKQPAEDAIVHFIDVGQADAIYIQLPDNNDILIDAGNRPDGPDVASYLKRQGVDDIELLIATHPHEDHIGGIPDVLKMFEVENIIDCGYPANTAVFNTYFTAVKAANTNHEQAAYQSFTFGNAALKIMTGHKYWDDINDYSVICRLDTGGVKVLFMGDAGKPVEEYLYGDISAEILKVGHHGSDTGTDHTFLDRVKPKAAIISAGAGNDYGHPSDEVLARLNSAGADIYRTDEQGTIIVTIEGSTYSVNTSPSADIPAPLIIPDEKGQYIGNKNSKKFHRPDCKPLPYLANQVVFDSREDALIAGYIPCKKCHP